MSFMKYASTVKFALWYFCFGNLRRTSCQEYGAALINFAETLSHTPFSFSVGLGGSMPQMKRRILNIASYQAPTPWKKAKSYALVLVISLLLISMSLCCLCSRKGNFLPSRSLGQHCFYYWSFFLFQRLWSTFVLYDLQKDHYQIYHPEQAYKRISPDSTTNSIVLCSDWKKKSLLQKIPWSMGSQSLSVWCLE